MITDFRTTITVTGLRIHARHGVMPQERKVGNIFEVSVSLHTDATSAILTDSLGGTVNYADVCEIIRKEMAIPSALLEHAAGRIANAIADSFPEVTGGRVVLKKITPPIPAQLESAGVQLEW